MKTFNDYQKEAVKTAIYPREYKVIYPTLGLTGEAGEVAEKVKKLIRDKDIKMITPEDKIDIVKEMGDCLWYLANLASDLNMSLSDIAHVNIQKLKHRQEKNLIQGSGDNREEVQTKLQLDAE